MSIATIIMVFFGLSSAVLCIIGITLGVSGVLISKCNELPSVAVKCVGFSIFFLYIAEIAMFFITDIIVRTN